MKEKAKSNLHKFYQTNKQIETEGKWIPCSGGVEFRVKRFGGYNSTKVQAITAELSKPYAREIEMKTLGDDKDRELAVTAFVKACVVDWKGYEEDGKEVPFSEEACIKLLCELPDLTQDLIQCATNKELYKSDLGNS